MWNAREPAVRPTDFKQIIGNLKEEFSRREQQDAQEFLSFLIDGLHEEVNYIVDKHCYQYPEVKGREIQDVALECWSMNLLRNWSIFSFLFTGQLGSELKCTKCQHVSWSFDPFMTLSLPITMTSLIPINIYLVPLPEILRKQYTTSNIGKAKGIQLVCLLVSKADTLEKIVKILYESYLTYCDEIKIQFISTCFGKVDIPIQDKSTIASIEQYSQMLNFWAIEMIKDEVRHKLKQINDLKTSKNAPENIEPEDLLYNKGNPKSVYVAQMPLVPNAQKARVFTLRLINRYIRRRSKNCGMQYKIKKLNDIPLLISANAGISNFEAYMRIWEAILPFLHTNSQYLQMENLWWCSESASKVKCKKPFILRKVNSNGQGCGICFWYDKCLGHIIYPDKTRYEINAEDYISIDWNLESNFQDVIKIDDIPMDISVEEIKTQIQKPIVLYDVIRRFLSEEDLPSTWCSTCKKALDQKKRLSLIRLPPILIFHLKRYKEKYIILFRKFLVYLPKTTLSLNFLLITST